PETRAAVALPPRRRGAGRTAAVPRVPAPLRPGTHLPLPQADPRLDPPPAAPPRPGRPMDLPDHRRLHPVASGPTPRRGPAPPLGETDRAGPADPRTGPSRVSPRPRHNRPSGHRAETLPPRPRSSERHA